MTSLNSNDRPGAELSNLKGMHILVVEDDWQLGIAMKSQLLALEADVVGLVATTAEAERSIAEHVPDVALVDFNLRGGERPYQLIDRLHDAGVRIVIISGYANVALNGKVEAILQKPVSEEQLIATLQQLRTSNP
jgi:CheY-like chemotaxis protein